MTSITVTACNLLVFAVIFMAAWHPASGSSSPICLDNNGNPVDWFIVYKLPRIKSSQNKLIKAGVGQAYMDANQQSWIMGQKSINDSGHAVYNTLQQIYKNRKSEELAYALYNDETPVHVSSDAGHTKGDFAFDAKTGFWLIHSVPKFPPATNESYRYPSNAERNGQTFLCVSFDYSMLDVIGKQLLFNRPQIFDKNFPQSFSSNVNMARALNGEFIKSAPFNNSVVLQSLKKQSFTSFAKCSKFGRDLYHDWVAPYFQSQLLVESWLNGRGALRSNCSNFHVYNVNMLNLMASEFSSSKDHSKWCASIPDKNGISGLEKTNYLVCIGDINRQEKQMRRGGGTLCMQIKSVWQSFSSLVLQKEEC